MFHALWTLALSGLDVFWVKSSTLARTICHKTVRSRFGPESSTPISRPDLTLEPTLAPPAFVGRVRLFPHNSLESDTACADLNSWACSPSSEGPTSPPKQSAQALLIPSAADIRARPVRERRSLRLRRGIPEPPPWPSSRACRKVRNLHDFVIPIGTAPTLTRIKPPRFTATIE